MDATFAMSRLGLLSDLRRIDIYSQNLANLDTVGYRRQVPVTVPFDTRLTALSEASSTNPATSSLSDNSLGPLRHTGNPLDLALAGSGYFVVETPGGVQYTRRGDFTIDAQGRLVSGHGFPVMGDGAEIRLPNSNFTVESDGSLVSDGTKIAKLDIARFDDPSILTYIGGGMFEAPGATPSRDPGVTPVKQGFLEDSNVSPAQEMVGLMETTRHLQMERNMLMAYDGLLNSAINTLAVF
ncbi:MAG: flagellar hook-basal body protein [Nevskiaceae bacterium]|nr:MAG: flagellar hook-basal body protein [Nevskiaceae bacterium]TBR75151.1 MAG: flagellar hook-basal body protein [Nevskiaceae bacterium]